MSKQAKMPSIAPLLGATLLTSICITSVGSVLASESSGRAAFEPIGAGESGQQDGLLWSAETVAEARWARQPENYVVGAGGRIVTQRQAPELIGGPTTGAYPIEAEDDHFDSDIQSAEPECGPSPATPAEITRLVVEAAQRHNVDAGFAVAVVTAESRLDQLRNSPKGARGPMQLMPETAERFGVADICDPEENIDGGVRYLRELTDEFRNPLLVAAAYNAGEGRVRQHGGIPPFRETIGYIAEVLNIQMGLEGRGSTADEPHSITDNHQPSSHAAGVITARERRQWIGGVMHF